MQIKRQGGKATEIYKDGDKYTATANNSLSPRLCTIVAFCFGQSFDLHDALTSHGLDRGGKLILLVKSDNVVSSTNGLSIDEDVWNGAAAGDITQKLLDMVSLWVEVEFDNVRSRDNGVAVKEDSLRFLAVRTIRL